ncbi:MAG TPA: alginate lyase family protein [Vicinamibacterales bacterium]
MIGRLRAWLGRGRSVTTAAPPAEIVPPPPSLADELSSLGSNLQTWLDERPRSGTLYSSLSAEALSAIAEKYPEQIAHTIAAAERALAHEFDMLGSGPFVPVDPGRQGRDGYQPIDWYLDPVQRLRFPERVPYREWNLLEMRPGLADVKFPWEMSRCQHWLPLAQAFRLTGDSRYAIEVLNQHDDFMAANPVGFGVNWTCTMDVAIGALNWAMAADLIHGARVIDAGRIADVYSSIFAHGHFIERNLENKYEVTSNHFLSNVVGLYGVAALFRDLPSGRRWLLRCREWLEQEMRVQVLADGADYESSVPYHRLVAELFLSGARLAQLDDRPLSADYLARLRTMFEFHDAVLRPDGLMPQIGDADDGRVHIFSNHGQWLPQDGRHLLAPAAAMFNEPVWWRADDEWAGWEAAWWGLSAPDSPPASRPPVRQLFPEAGLAVDKHHGQYLLISNGKVGTNGFGNHKHNDLLSFEFHDRGQPLIVDPGSYVYTSNPDARNRFRSTVSHNTLVVDDEEQNEFKAEWLFRMFEKAKPEHLRFDASDRITVYQGRHDGYQRLAGAVIHERRFELDHGSGTLTIDDSLEGSGNHSLRWSFHCAPGIVASFDRQGMQLASNQSRWLLRAEQTLTASVSEGFYSPSYGVAVANAVVAYSTTASLARKRQWRFVLERLS